MAVAITMAVGMLTNNLLAALVTGYRPRSERVSERRPPAIAARTFKKPRGG